MRRPLLISAGILLALFTARRPMFDLLVRQMLYPAPPVEVPPPPAPLEEVALEIAGGANVVAWASPGAVVNPGERPAVLFFHGNGENLETMSRARLYDRMADLGVHFLAVDYPGYGRSTGQPSQASLTAAGLAGFDRLRERFPGSPVIVLGWSLGAAVAMQTAAGRVGEVDRLILLSAWDDLETLGKVHVPGWMVGLSLRDAYDSLAAAATLECPVLMVHGEEDAIIPIAHGRRLAGAFSEPPRFVEVPDTGHNDLLARQLVWAEISGFLP